MLEEVTKKVTISKLKFFLFIFLAFCLGGIIAMSGNQSKVVTKTEVKEVEKNQAEWKQLKEVDDQVLLKAGSGFGICSQMVNSASVLDVEGVNRGTKELKTLTSEINQLGAQRKSLLSKLGY